MSNCVELNATTTIHTFAFATFVRYAKEIHRIDGVQNESGQMKHQLI